MTEEEAKTKWCPFARVVGSLGEIEGAADLHIVTGNRNNPNGNGPTELPKCLGSGCMAWRHTFNDALSKIKDGHCGLAGKP